MLEVPFLCVHKVVETCYIGRLVTLVARIFVGAWASGVVGLSTQTIWSLGGRLLSALL